MGRIISNISLPIIMYLPRFLYFNLLWLQTKLLWVEHMKLSHSILLSEYELMIWIIWFISQCYLLFVVLFLQWERMCRNAYGCLNGFYITFWSKKINHCLSAHILSEKHLFLLKASSLGDGERRQLLCLRWPCP